MPAFTTIAAAAGLAATAGTTAGSFIQAGKQRDAMLDAQKKADDAMQAARKKLGEDEKHAAEKADEARKLELYEEHREADTAAKAAASVMSNGFYDKSVWEDEGNDYMGIQII